MLNKIRLNSDLNLDALLIRSRSAHRNTGSEAEPINSDQFVDKSQTIKFATFAMPGPSHPCTAKNCHCPDYKPVGPHMFGKTPACKCGHQYEAHPFKQQDCFTWKDLAGGAQ